MSAATAQDMESNQPVIMFVDDEERVLKSMRAMFRRDYEVHLANSGAEALELLAEHEIDVVVSDQRMPEMTGVEVLAEIKSRSPDTVRILLTGYADLAAVEASINEAEVFKYLMKPCPAEEVRGAVKAGLDLRGETGSLVSVVTVGEPEMGEAPVETKPAPAKTAPIPAKKSAVAKPLAGEVVSDKRIRNVEVLVLSDDKTFFKGVDEACPARKLHRARTLDDALELVRANPIGVLVTDLAVDEREIGELSQAVRAITPEMVIILASDRSDANVLIQLINSGQVFRFLLKPLQIGQCKIWLASALRRFVESSGNAIAHLDPAAQPSAWTRFRNWFLGVQG